MPLNFPQYFEFESINPGYTLSPNTLPLLQEIWDWLYSESTLSYFSPEGLLIPNGFLGIQSKLNNIGYLVIVPHELAEELRDLVVDGLLGQNKNNGKKMERSQLPKFLLEKCPKLHDKLTKDNLKPDPFPELHDNWPWNSRKFMKSQKPITGRVNLPSSAGHNSNLCMYKHIYTYDYYGQYFGSADCFCWAMMRIPGKKNYEKTLKELQKAITYSGDKPLIVICPENIQSSLVEMNSIYKHGPFGIGKNNYAFGLKKVLLHEVGHHMFPITLFGETSDTNGWPECMANWFVYHYLSYEERIGLYFWTSNQPVPYSCYRALLGLMMPKGASTMLSAFNLSDRKAFIVEVETLCSNSIDPSEYGSFERIFLKYPWLCGDTWKNNIDDVELYRDRILEYPWSFLLEGVNIFENHNLLTDAEVLFQLLIKPQLYNGMFCNLKSSIPQCRTPFCFINTSEYHKFIKKVAQRRPTSIGFLRTH